MVVGTKEKGQAKRALSAYIQRLTPLWEYASMIEISIWLFAQIGPAAGVG
jgi:hypothetical protein